MGFNKQREGVRIIPPFARGGFKNPFSKALETQISLHKREEKRGSIRLKIQSPCFPLHQGGF